MNDSISRQAAIDAIMGQPPEPHYPSWYAEQIKALPPVQSDVIRCKDCKKNPQWEWVGCPMTGKDTRKPDDFFSYAERREGEG